MRGLVLAIVTVFLLFIPRKITAWDHRDHEKHGKYHGNDDEFDDRDHHGRFAVACFRDNLLVIYDHYQPAGLSPVCLGWMGS